MKKVLFILTLLATPLVIGYVQSPTPELPYDAWEGLTPDQVWFIKNF